MTENAAPSPTPPRGPGRTLRLATGVNEDILSEVPSERSKFTSIGGVITGTASMAMISMAAALYWVFGGFNVLIIFFLPIWGLFIFSLDRWLISSTPTGGSVALFFQVLLPRVFLSVVMGVILAEPLLLAVFNTAITEKVLADRQQELTKRESSYQRCNPLPGSGQPAGGSECDDFRLSGSDAPSDKQSQVLELQVQLRQAQANFDAESKEYAALQNKARLECNGTSGPGLSGKSGVGVNCNRLRAEADQYRADHNIDAQQSGIDDLNRRINGLTDASSAARTKFEQSRDEAIENDKRATVARQGNIGLLERFDALDDLVDESTYVHATEWAIRIFFVIVDALPVILKVLGGRSYYDRVNTLSLDTALAKAERRYRDSLREKSPAAADDPASLEDAVRNGIQTALFGPPPTNYNGWVNVSLGDDRAELIESVDGRRIRVGDDSRFDMKVEVSPARLAAIAERLAVADGVDKSDIDFSVEVDSDRPELRRPATPLRLNAPDDTAHVLYSFDLSRSSLASPPWMWVRVSSNGQIVQSLEMIVERRAEVVADRS